MKKVSKNYMAIDQYGQTYHNLGPNPRKKLMEIFDSSRAVKMYQDKNDGRSVHTGYIIGQSWLTLYEVKLFEGSA